MGVAWAKSASARALRPVRGGGVRSASGRSGRSLPGGRAGSRSGSRCVDDDEGIGLVGLKLRRDGGVGALAVGGLSWWVAFDFSRRAF